MEHETIANFENELDHIIAHLKLAYRQEQHVTTEQLFYLLGVGHTIFSIMPWNHPRMEELDQWLWMVRTKACARGVTQAGPSFTRAFPTRQDYRQPDGIAVTAR